MPTASPGTLLGLLVAAATLAAAAILAFRQGTDRRRRGDELPAADARHFARQDLRRWTGTALMAALAVGMAITTRLGPPRDRPAARRLARTWVGLCVLVIAVLALALLDWIATAAYARRHRRTLARNHLAALEAEIRRHRGEARGRDRPGTNGAPGDPPSR